MNKADRPDAGLFVKNLRLMLAPAFHTHAQPVPIIRTIASQKEGIDELYTAIEQNKAANAERRHFLLAEKAYHLIREKRMKDIDKKDLATAIAGEENFNLYRFVKQYISRG